MHPIITLALKVLHPYTNTCSPSSVEIVAKGAVEDFGGAVPRYSRFVPPLDRAPYFKYVKLCGTVSLL